MMFLVDAHCHLNREYYPDGLADIFARAAENGVRRLLFASADVATSREAAELAELQREAPELYALVGVHPHEAERAAPDYIARLEELAGGERVSAIGEIGLDYFYDHSPRDVQRRVFREQIGLAKRLGKPIVIHVRDAQEKGAGDANGELLRILREEGAAESGGVIHCFSGNREEAEAALELGFYLSFAGPVTYPKNQALREIAMATPLDRILCETDSPYLAPQGFRGKQNEPRHVRSVYEYLSMLKGLSLEDFARAVKENGERLFGWAAKEDV
ncbi:MAG: TatD family hydrolase [Synergistaceae bacterium]|nr:TatD family hydrolase [Synergistaceae bacterium]